MVSSYAIYFSCKFNLSNDSSYQVPKEVGKVSTESPTFIQPIAQRKDGIQALFAKQKEAKISSPVPTPPSSQSAFKEKKRKRSVSPLSAKDDEKQTEISSKVQRLNTWEDDSDIEYIDQRKNVSKTVRRNAVWGIF